ncbi:hypothetical protein EDD15DRAFT_2167987 [Pisolithus albus]|nr:hypothetical protein EDD15DRAFT_2171257 [Pisolithus albus]KAI5992678.1 hypothetical protein EDD15DRAFT_2167987 [Pisolithus albus]
MDYQPYYPPITLRRTFERDRSPSPSASRVTLRRIFDFDTVRLSEEQEVGPSPNGLIHRPRGALSKPNHGGYTLRQVLNWNDKTYKCVQGGLHEVCEEYLDLRLTFPNQSPAAVAMFLNAARARFPILNEYQDQWPAQDFAAMYLKNKVGADKAKSRVRTRCTNTPQTVLDG